MFTAEPLTGLSGGGDSVFFVVVAQPASPARIATIVIERVHPVT
jgi:hypothetical protein